MPSEAKTERIEIRVTPRQKRLIEKALQAEGRTMSEFVATSAIRSARKTIKLYQDADYEPLTLAERIQFLTAALDPQPPTPALLDLMAKHKAMFPDQYK